MCFERWFLSFILIFGVTSCRFFEIKKVDPKELMKQELEKLRGGGVAENPLFEACKNFSTKKAQKNCFERELCNHIAAYLAKQEFRIQEDIEDTLWIPLLVDATGNLHIETFEVPDDISSQVPSLFQLLEESIEKLPSLQPAHIRGIAIGTRYRLPLVLKAE